jgi:hypothetical protein
MLGHDLDLDQCGPGMAATDFVSTLPFVNNRGWSWG